MARWPEGLRFHWPLIEPDVRICRIRLSDKDSRFRVQVGATKLRQIDQAVPMADLFVGEACDSPMLLAKLSADFGTTGSVAFSAERLAGDSS